MKVSNCSRTPGQPEAILIITCWPPTHPLVRTTLSAPRLSGHSGSTTHHTNGTHLRTEQKGQNCLWHWQQYLQHSPHMVFSQCSHTSTSRSCLQPQHSPLTLPLPPPPLPLPGVPALLLWVAPMPFCEGEKYLRRPECSVTGSLGGEGAVRPETLSLVGLAPRNRRAFVLSVGTHAWQGHTLSSDTHQRSAHRTPPASLAPWPFDRSPRASCAGEA